MFIDEHYCHDMYTNLRIISESMCRYMAHKVKPGIWVSKVSMVKLEYCS